MLARKPVARWTYNCRGETEATGDAVVVDGGLDGCARSCSSSPLYGCTYIRLAAARPIDKATR